MPVVPLVFFGYSSTMSESSEAELARTKESYRKQIAHCLEHAGDLIAAAERVLSDDNGFPNVAYHLAVSAMEEIGKAGILSTHAAVGDRLGRQSERRLDDHAYKLMHAIWSPRLSGKIDPKDFEEARRFAESTHARRLRGLYVDHHNGESTAPKDAVLLGHATSLLNLAKASLELQLERGVPTEPANEDLDWYLAAVSDDNQRVRLFSQSFIAKYEEFGGDTRAWVRWARDEFNRVAAEEQAILQREIARQANPAEEAKPRWTMKIRLHTASHSIRPSALKYWNDRIESVKLLAVPSKKQELLMQIEISDGVKVDQLFDSGLSLSKLYIAALNAGSAGFFWYELSGQTQTYFESITDRENPGYSIHVAKAKGLVELWSEADGQRRYVALEDNHLDHAMKFLAAYGGLPDEIAAPIFGEYLRGLITLSKTDVHLSLESNAHGAFLLALKRAMVHFKDWDGADNGLISALHQVLSPVMPEEEHRTQLFAALNCALAATRLPVQLIPSAFSISISLLWRIGYGRNSCGKPPISARRRWTEMRHDKKRFATFSI
jgi:AbiV family abortive infection protein